jgi:hypothetical protein
MGGCLRHAAHEQQTARARNLLRHYPIFGSASV